jgi:hypothetical protein
MTRALTSEFRKFFTTRLWWGMTIAMVLAGAALAGLFGALVQPDGGFGAGGGPGAPQMHLDATEIANNVYSSGISFGYLLTLAIGVLVIGAEYRHKTITGTFLATPRRLRAMGAKILSLLGIGGFYGVLFVAASALVGGLVLSARGFEAFPSGEVFRTLALVLLVLGLWALIGLGAGILIPNQVAALLITIGVAWIVEPIAGLLLSTQDWGADVAQYLPSQATGAVLQTMTSPDGQQLSWWAGVVTLAVYAAVLSGVGSWLTIRRDIS